MHFKKRNFTERFLWLIAAIAFAINAYYLVVQDHIPKWVKLINLIGWIIIIILSLKDIKRNKINAQD
jgi:hypothetical protein